MPCVDLFFFLRVSLVFRVANWIIIYIVLISFHRLQEKKKKREGKNLVFISFRNKIVAVSIGIEKNMKEKRYAEGFVNHYGITEHYKGKTFLSLFIIMGLSLISNYSC